MRIVVIGAGMSGLGTAHHLVHHGVSDVLVLEKQAVVGGLCAAVPHPVNTFDLGSHRIHPECDPALLARLEDLLDEPLNVNRRRGRLRLLDTYVDYPITSAQMFHALGITQTFLLGASLGWHRARASIRTLLAPPAPSNYERYLLDHAGARAYRLFYEPYARKVWGCEPSEISITAVKKRVSMNGPVSFLKDIARHYLGGHAPRRYYYPPGGIGAIPRAFAREIVAAGGECLTSVEVRAIRSRRRGVEVVYQAGGNPRSRTVRADVVVSTIPIDDLCRLTGLNSHPDAPGPKPPESEQGAGPSHGQLEYRSTPFPLEWTGLRLAYLRLTRQVLMEGETFYFPELKYLFGRVSVPDRYAPGLVADGEHWVVCEVPWGARRAARRMETAHLLDRCAEDLVAARLLEDAGQYHPDASFVVDLPKVYPVYRQGWQAELERVLDALATKHGSVYSSGRPGLFLHNNLDHAIQIGIALGRHLLAGKGPREWYAQVRTFHRLKLRD